VVTIKGGLFHKIGTVLPADGKLPAFAQIFVVGQGGAEEAATRLAMATNGGSSTYRGKWKLDPTIVEKLQDFLYSYNPYAKLYRRAGEILAAGKEIRVALVTVEKCGKDYRRYNAPTTEEIGIIIEGDGEIRAPRHVMLETREGDLQEITDMHSAYFPLRYPLFFPYGSKQWEPTFKTLAKTREFGLILQ
jgi:hypothetical protein